MHHRREAAKGAANSLRLRFAHGAFREELNAPYGSYGSAFIKSADR